MFAEMLTWATGDRDLECRVCGASGEGELLAEINALGQVGLEAIRCHTCGSIQLSHEPREFSPTRQSIDDYVEWGAGIGAVAAMFADVDHSPSTRLLDVGCSYPFALDLARFLFGWEVLGVEPSPASRRGSRELQVPVRTEFLGPDSTIGAGFDLVLASEVVEHVSDPGAFLSAIRERLAPTGTLLLTTPAAEVVSPDESTNQILLAISPGFHVFVASVRGMEILLARSGFGSCSVVRDGGTLRVVARVEASSETASIPHRPVSAEDLDRYYEWRGYRSRAKSALALGMLTRLFRLRVARGDFDRAASVIPRLNRSARAIHRINLRRPGAVRSRKRFMRNPPVGLMGASFSLGMYELLHLDRAARAASYFALCERITMAALGKMDIVDGDAVDLNFQAPFHRGLALARFDPSAASAVAMLLPGKIDSLYLRAEDVVASRQCRIYTEIVAHGTYTAGAGLDQVVATTAVRLASDEDLEFRTAGLDAVFSLGMAALNSADSRGAVDWFDRCLRVSLGAPASRHTSGLIMATRTHLAMARERMLAEFSQQPPDELGSE